MYLEFEEMPEDARIWIYQANRKLNSNEISMVEDRLKQFCQNWNTHGTLMPTSFTILNDQILVLAVDESNLGASGCSIDSSVRVLSEIESELGLNLRDQGKVSIKKSEEEIQVLPALGIKTALAESKISADKEVINPRIQTKRELQRLWIPISESWLNKYFPN
ncbi:hypothetical protein [Algoriphagus sediminis]|uniref:ABC transporter ATPase n=1 Tax=Algoriphagus sediminis TaxID=3057113 RepID=A0ABT7YEG1_9BACT|nr:hypothetical protein [Algoriphagus sediminis]MDN3204922.1 hypothetical protein [Algoriphagus sediminis]